MATIERRTPQCRPIGVGSKPRHALPESPAPPDCRRNKAGSRTPPHPKRCQPSAAHCQGKEPSPPRPFPLTFDSCGAPVAGDKGRVPHPSRDPLACSQRPHSGRGKGEESSRASPRNESFPFSRPSHRAQRRRRKASPKQREELAQAGRPARQAGTGPTSRNLLP